MKRRFTQVEKGELLMIAEIVGNEGHDVEELTKLLGITVEDILDRFGDRLLEHRELFLSASVYVSPGVLDDPDEDDETSEGPWD